MDKRIHLLNKASVFNKDIYTLCGYHAQDQRVSFISLQEWGFFGYALKPDCESCILLHMARPDEAY